MRFLSIVLVVLGGVALALLPLTSTALAVAGAVVVIATLIRPQVGLCLLVFSVPFGALRTLSVSGASVSATEVLVALVAAAWLARGVARRQIRIVHAPLIVPLLLFILAQILSLFDALSLTMAFAEIIKWAEVLAVYVIASSLLDGDGETRGRADAETNTVPASARPRIPVSQGLRVCLSLLLTAALAEALLGAYQFVTHSGPEWFSIGRFMRAYGTFAQPNPYAGYLDLSLPLGYALLLTQSAIIRPSRWEKAALAVWLAVVGAAFVMSLSRGAWLGLAAAVAVISLLHSRRTAVLATAGGVAAAMLLILGSADLLPAFVTQRFSAITDYLRVFDVRGVEVTDANFAVVERMAHWQAAWGMVNDRPWLGFGIGNYPAAYPRYSLAGWKEDLGHAHNFPLNVAAETGLIGLAAYLLFLAAALWTCWRTVQCLEDGVPRAVALGVLGVLIAKISHEMLDNLWVHGMGVQVALLLALASSGSSALSRCGHHAHRAP